MTFLTTDEARAQILEEIDALEDPLGTFYPDPKDQARVLAAIERADGQFREYKVVAKDGSTHVQMWADFELPNGSRISVGHDVTEQRQIEASLRQSQKTSGDIKGINVLPEG